MKKAVYAGSFDPITNGHVWMIQKASELFGGLIVAIGINPDKNYTFSLEERLEMLKEITSRFDNVTVASFENQLLVNYAESASADYILRGIRNGEDYEYERGMRNINDDINSGITTIFLMPPRGLAEVSSSLVKGLIGPEGWEKVTRGYVPKAVYKKFLEKFNGHLKRWTELWGRINAQGNPKEVYGKLAELYSQTYRAYHNLVHISDSLTEFDKVRSLTENPDAVEMALWFHDGIYTLGARDNEERSAELASETLKNARVKEGFVTLVKDLVLATTHNIPLKDKDAQFLVDIDLAILGKPAEEFDKSEIDIRKEYNCFSDEEFRVGRIRTVEGFLNRPRIYSTDLFKEKYEEQARRNLERSLARLKG